MPTIIVCDDSNFMRNRIKSIISALNVTIIEAVNGKECISLVEQHSVDAIVIDLLMPEMTGNQVLAELKARNLSIPTVVVSADVQSSTREECIQLGAVAFFNKPPQAAELTQFLAKLLNMQ